MTASLSCPVLLLLTHSFLAGCAVQPEGPEVYPERGPIGKADLVGSCADTNCNSKSLHGNCWCDELCVVVGDCCGDRAQECAEEAFVRVGQFVPNDEALTICVYDDAYGNLIGTLAEGAPFRFVSEYVSLPAGAEAVVEVRAGDEPCPVEQCGSGALATVPLELAADASSTVVVRGLPADATGAVPAVCGPPTFDGTCDASRSLEVAIVQDADAPGLRFSANTANLPFAFDLCHDPDSLEGPQPPRPLLTSVAYGATTAYAEHDGLESGTLVLTIDVGGEPCTIADADGDDVPETLLGELPLPLPIPPLPGVTGQVDRFAADGSVTLFGSGLLPPRESTTDPLIFAVADGG